LGTLVQDLSTNRIKPLREVSGQAEKEEQKGEGRTQGGILNKTAGERATAKVLRIG